MRSSKVHHSGRPLAVLISFLVLGLAAPIAQAVPLFFDFAGTCGINCAQLGMNAGDVVSGYFEIDDSALLNNIVEAGEVTSFQFTLGNVSLDNGFFDFVIDSSLVLNGAMDGFASGSFSVWDTFAGSLFTEFEFLDSWAYYEAGQFANGTFGDGQFMSRDRALPAPEPAILLLLGIGLIGLTGFSRLRLK